MPQVAALLISPQLVAISGIVPQPVALCLALAVLAQTVAPIVPQPAALSEMRAFGQQTVAQIRRDADTLDGTPASA